LQSIADNNAGYVLTSNGASLPSWQAAPATVDDVIYTALTTAGSSTYTIGANSVSICVAVFGSGAGGITYTSGGGGGGGADFNYMMAPVSYFGGNGASVAYTVAAGGGAGVAGSASKFGNVVAQGGLKGSTTTGGAALTNWSYGNIYVGASIGGSGKGGNIGAAGTTNANSFLPTGGGGGHTTTPGAGGALQYALTAGNTQILAGGTAGTIGTPTGGAGNSPTITPYGLGLMGGTGGGGAYATGNGGKGGQPGGGGGGAGVTSGTAGAGGDGAIYIWEYI